MSDLTEIQQVALEQLQQITAGEDPDREVAVLRSVNWNVEKAAQKFFDEDPNEPQRSTAGPSQPNSTPRTLEQMSIDDSEQGDTPSSSLSRKAPGRGIAPAYPSGSSPKALPWSLLSILSFPFSLLGGIIGFILRLLRFPIGRATLRPGTGRGIGGLGLGLAGRGIVEDPATVAERFVRELEDETGALTVSHATGASTEEKAGSSSAGKAREDRKLLPDIFIGSYDQALKAAETDLRVLCAIVLSSEHDDTPEFRRAVMTDPDFVKTLTDNDFIVWAGDIRYRDAYQTSHKLGATTYPFVAFIALHPVPQNVGGPSATRSGSGPRLTVLSRHEGSPSSKTSAATLTTHITTSLVPRVTPLLTRLRTERWEREQERRLREDQDRAFAEAAARDKERVLKRQAEERAAADAARKTEQERRAKELRKSNIAAWRRYARRVLLVPEAKTDGVRIGVRTPDGKRFIRMFGRQHTAVNVYTFVETLFIPTSDDPDNDPSDPPSGYGNCDEHEWTFRLVTSFPRKEIPPTKDITLETLPELRGGANLVLEMYDIINGHPADSDGEASSDAESD